MGVRYWQHRVTSISDVEAESRVRIGLRPSGTTSSTGSEDGCRGSFPGHGCCSSTGDFCDSSMQFVTRFDRVQECVKAKRMCHTYMLVTE